MVPGITGKFAPLALVPIETPPVGTVYQIYKILSPSGKFYIGLTSQTALVRWRNHIRKAYVRPEYNHGLYNAIRKYGPAAFELTVVGVASSKQEAQRMERSAIAAAHTWMAPSLRSAGRGRR